MHLHLLIEIKTFSKENLEFFFNNKNIYKRTRTLLIFL